MDNRKVNMGIIISSFVLLAVLAIVLICTAITDTKGSSNINAPSEYGTFEQRITACEALALNAFAGGMEPNSTYKIKCKNDISEFYINDKLVLSVMIPEGNLSKTQIDAVTEATLAQKELASTAINQVMSFFKESNLFDENTRNELNAHLINIPIYSAASLGESLVEGIYKDGKIYMSKNIHYDSLWIVRHEYFHAVREFLSLGVENEELYATSVDEGFTEILNYLSDPEISLSNIVCGEINSSINENYVSAYFEYFPYLYSYMARYGSKEVLTSFLCSSLNTLDENRKEDLKFIAMALTNLNNSYDAVCVLNTISCIWVNEYESIG